MCTSLVFENPIFSYSSPVLVWIFFNFYAMSVITFCFLISVIFKKASVAANVGSIFFFVSLLPYNKLNEKFYSFNYSLKVLYCLLVNSGMGQGVYQMLVAEGNEEGIHFLNLFTREPNIGFSMGEVMVAMIFGAIFQMLLTLYIEKVFPGEIGIPEPFYYPIKPLLRYLKKRMGYNLMQNRDAILQERRISGSEYEDEPTNLKAGIRISNLSKSFGNKPAVNKLNLNIFEDQITVLLGHNGAGKTTTMAMLTGMFSPSSGTAYLNGKDVRTEIDEARRSLGLCPQHNILFDELTVAEHIIFFAQLKGIQGRREIGEEVRRYVSLLDLKDKTNAQSYTLSGGMKRKLSVGIALCGNSKVVVLDEPTSGMDPAGRRQLWDLLIAEKKGRTILLTTHHMDEADILGDRIAIMAEGSLRTVGSSFFLKKKFGTGYKLICVKEPGCDSNAILEVLQQFAPDTQIGSDVQTEATFIISELHMPIFQDIFKELEDNARNLRISSFGCNLSTLEEVFLKLGTDSYQPSEVENQENQNSNQQEYEGSTTILFNDFVSSGQVTGMTLMLYQLQAMILKKCHYLQRNYRSILYMTLFSTWMIVILMSAPAFDFTEAPLLSISFESYDETVTIIEYDDSSKSFMNSYENLLSSENSVERIKDDMATYYLKKSNKSLATMTRKYLVGATLKTDGFEAWFNGEPLHTMPLTLNTINRAIIKNFMGNNHDILLTNKPFAKISHSDDGFSVQPAYSGTIAVFFLFFFLLIYWPSIFIGFYIKERDSRAKLLQFISGANRFIYWFASFLFDYVIFFVVICSLLGGVASFQRFNFSTAKEMGTFLLIFSLYGFATLPLVYVLSYLFKKPSTGESMVAVFGILCKS